MSDYKVTDSELTGIANAIRTKGGTSSPLVFPNGFSSAIADIPSGGGSTLVQKTITQNGTYDPSDDSADGYSLVTVNVGSVSGNITYGFAEPDPQSGSEQDLYVHVSSISDFTILNPFYNGYNASSFFAGQNTNDAYKAFNNSNDYWSTSDHNFNDMYIGCDMGSAVVCTVAALKPRVWDHNTQIKDFTIEGSNDKSSWTVLGSATMEQSWGERHGASSSSMSDVWYEVVLNNNTAYRYYRINASTTFSATCTLFEVAFGVASASPSIDFYEDVYKKVNGQWEALVKK